MVNLYGIFFESKLVYVGQTTSKLNKRMSDHVARAKYQPSACPKLYAKINKHGKDKFYIRLLAQTTSEEIGDVFETELIKANNLVNAGLNCASGGRVNRGMKKTEEQKSRHSALMKQRYKEGLNPFATWNGSAEQKALVSKTHKGKITSEETKRKISKANRKPR